MRRAFLSALLALAALAVAGAGGPNGAKAEFRLALVPPLGERTEAAAVSELALRRIAESQGLPHRFIDSPEELGGYPLAVLAEAPSNKDLDPRWTEALYAYVEEGGALLAPGRPGSELYPLLGIRDLSSKRTRTRLEFSGSDPALAYVDHPRERVLSLGNGERTVYPEVIWSHGAESDGSGEVLARFEDGSAALTRNYYGRGTVYFLGVSLAETVLLPQSGGDYEAQREFVNAVEPSADAILLIVKAMYEEYVPRAAYLSPIPRARPTALVLTHDVDAQSSFLDSLKFAALAEEFGARSTFFINTKYFKDSMDIGYYLIPENLRAVRELARRGHEIASHTVAHSKEFDRAPLGDPGVRFADYRPDKRITVHGEARVSKELLDRDVKGQDTVSFRSGYLAFPESLIPTLQAAGYRYDSSFSANDALTTFPYFALPLRKPGAEQSEVLEIPVTLDDALGFLTKARVEEAESRWREVVKAHADNESVTVLLVHPSDTRGETYKLKAQRSVMEYARSLDAWMGCLKDFGDFWTARAGTEIASVQADGRSLEIRLSVPSSQLHPWIGIAVPKAARYDSVRVLDSSGSPLPFRARVSGGKLFLGQP